MKLEEFKNYVDKNIMSIMSKSNEEEKDLLNTMIKIINQLCEKERELIIYLKEEIKDGRPQKNDKYGNLLLWHMGYFDACKEILSKIEKR